MAVVGNSLTLSWTLLAQSGEPNLEFRYPADTQGIKLRVYHGVQDNVPNRRIVKTILRTKTAGQEYNFRNVGRNYELLRVNIVLATKQEAREFTDFFKNIIKGSSDVFLFKNNISNEEYIVRSMENRLDMGEAEGGPYSFTLLLKKESPYAGNSSTFIWNIPEGLPPGSGDWEFNADAPAHIVGTSVSPMGTVSVIMDGDSISEIYLAYDRPIGSSGWLQYFKWNFSTNFWDFKFQLGNYAYVRLQYDEFIGGTNQHSVILWKNFYWFRSYGNSLKSGDTSRHIVYTSDWHPSDFFTYGTSYRGTKNIWVTPDMLGWGYVKNNVSYFYYITFPGDTPTRFDPFVTLGFGAYPNGAGYKGGAIAEFDGNYNPYRGSVIIWLNTVAGPDYYKYYILIDTTDGISFTAYEWTNFLYLNGNWLYPIYDPDIGDLFYLVAGNMADSDNLWLWSVKISDGTIIPECFVSDGTRVTTGMFYKFGKLWMGTGDGGKEMGYYDKGTSSMVWLPATTPGSPPWNTWTSFFHDGTYFRLAKVTDSLGADQFENQDLRRI